MRTIASLAVTTVLALMAWGWVANILKLAGSIDPFTAIDALRILGIFIAPLGILLGWFF